MPQKTRYASTTAGGARSSTGDRRQQTPEAPSCAQATRALPARSETRPPPTLPSAPAAITTKDQSATLRPGAQAASATGTKAQNAYSSHMCPK